MILMMLKHEVPCIWLVCVLELGLVMQEYTYRKYCCIINFSLCGIVHNIILLVP